MQHSTFQRLIALIGEEKFKILQNKTVLIVGLGGVGGYVTESLARSGIGSIIIVDYDIVDDTNINRQIIALNSTIGRKKVDVFENRILDINRNCKVIKYDLFFNEDTCGKVFSNKIDFIVDACDSINTKKMIIKEAIKRKIDFISSMGTANKLDPKLLEIIDLNKTINDPIARIMRKFVKCEKIAEKIMVLSSKEIPIKNGSTLASNAFVPPIAGLLIGDYVVKKLIGK